MDKVEQLEDEIEELNTRSGLVKMMKTPDFEIYNPGKPNDFEKILAQRKQTKIELERQLKAEKTRKESEQDRFKSSEQAMNLEESGEEAYQRRAAKSDKGFEMLKKFGYTG